MDKLVGAGKRLVTGESLFTTVFSHAGGSGKAKVAFAAPYPGTIVPMTLSNYGGTIIAQKDSFLCAARGVQIGLHFQKKVMTALFGGEGFIMQKLTGDGLVSMNSARCSGFTEGIAESVALEVMNGRYGNTRRSPVSTRDLNEGLTFDDPILTQRDLEQTDNGWKQFFRYLFRSDEWAPNDLPSLPVCDARDVTPFQLLRALATVRFPVRSPTVFEVLQVLQQQVPGFTARDAAIYAAVSDPANTPSENHASLCTALQPRRTP